MSAAPPASILIADCGSAATKVGLVERVGEEFRMIGSARALTTVEPPFSDISQGVARAVAELEILTGRRLLTEQKDLIRPERASGEGVDSFIAATSAALPFRVGVIGLSRNLSLTGALKALTSTYAVVEHTIAVDEESGRWGTKARDGHAGGPSAAVERLTVQCPDVIVMVGGVDGGPIAPLVEMADIVATVGAALDEGSRPLVLFAGNHEARQSVAQRISPLMELRTVDNVQPKLGAENLAPLKAELDRLYQERRLKTIPGWSQLSGWSTCPIVSSAHAYEKVAQFLAKRFGLRVLAIDLGAAATIFIHAKDGNVSRVVTADAGHAFGLDQLVERIGMDRIARWLPPTIDVEDAHACLLNQALRPWTTPTLSEELVVLNAASREALLLHPELAEETWRADLVLLSGAPVARGSKAGALMLMALDALPVQGIFSVAADGMGLAPALGALAGVNAEAAAQVLEHDVLLTLGTALIPSVSRSTGDGPILQARIENAGGGQIEAQISRGSLEFIPLSIVEKARVEIRPVPGVDMHVPLTNGVFNREMEGGAAGVIIDARGRPLEFEQDMQQQRDRVQRWMWDVGA